MDARKPSEEDIFEMARQLTNPHPRAAYVKEACGDDAKLHLRVTALLTAYERKPGFLEQPPPEVSANAVTEAQNRDVVSAIAGERVGRYKLLEKIGEGGCGVVYVADQEEPVRRRVALKVIKLGMDTKQVVARFEAERQALAMMDHPNIAKVLDAGATDQGRPYFVMELVRGIRITDYCDQNNVPIQGRLDLFIQVCHAIQHAHQKGIIHRDIKPSNILVTLNDGVPVPKVIDFGIAKATEGRLTDATVYTQLHQFLGTPAYMSPEQAEMSGLDIDTRSDIYSLGVLLYELLTGKTPFDAQELVAQGVDAMRRTIREKEPAKPSTRFATLNGEELTTTAERRSIESSKLAKLLRGDLDWIAMKCLEKDRTRRYETAIGLAADLERHLGNEVVVARSPSPAYQFRKFARRNRVALGVAAGIAVLLVLGMIGTGLALKRALRAESSLRGQLAETEKAQKELKQVSDFQGGMLSEIDTTQAGKDLMADVHERFAAALEKAGVPESQRLAQSEALRDQLARVNATDTAAAMIDRTILKPAIKAIEEKFKNQPKVDAALRQALADLYRIIGSYDAAYPLQKSALETRRRLSDYEADSETLNYSISGMAVLLLFQGKLAEAEPYCRQHLEIQRKLGGEHTNTIAAIENMGFLLQGLGKLPEAERYYREALEKNRRVLTEEHPNTLTAMHNVGFVLREQGKLAEAEPYLREALEKRRRRGEENLDTLGAIRSWGHLLQAQGKLADAERHFREVLEKVRRLKGEGFDRTIISTEDLGFVLQLQGKLAEAEPYLREALEKNRRVFTEEHPNTLASINRLGMLLQAQDKFAEAESEYARGIAVCNRSYSSPQPFTAMFLHHHADALRMLNRLDEAKAEARQAMDLYRDHPDWSAREADRSASILVAILTTQGLGEESLAVQRELVAIQRRTVPPSSAALGSALSTLGLALLQRTTLDATREAEALLNECLEIRVKTMPGDWHIPNTRSMLGGAILLIAEMDPSLAPAARADRLREAESLLLDGYAGLKDDPAVPTPAQTNGADYRREAHVRVMRLYEVWDKAEPGKHHDVKAAEWRQRLDASPAPAAASEKKP